MLMRSLCIPYLTIRDPAIQALCLGHGHTATVCQAPESQNFDQPTWSYYASQIANTTTTQRP